MKILNPETLPATIRGLECDSCRHRVVMGQMSTDPDREGSDVQRGAEIARFVTLDMEQSGSLMRADFCPACASEILEGIRRFLPKFRRIARRDPRNGARTFDYHAIDAKSGSIFAVSSLIDDGA